MKWTVKNYNCNKDKIEDYDLFPYFEKFLLEIKKKIETREEFAKAIDLAMEGCLEVSKLQKEALMKKYSTE